MNEKIYETPISIQTRSRPKPNTLFIISEGKDGGNKTVIYIYRPKKFNWLQRKLWKWAFGITIKHGEDLSIT